MASIVELAKRLCEVSEKSYLNPYTYITWQESMPKEQWFMSPELISIYGTSEYDKLDLKQKQILSFYESVNFFSLNIHGEKSLVEGIAHRLYSKELKDLAPYLHHFLDEENKHMIYFGGFCQRYAGKVYRNRKLEIPREYAKGEEDFLFFARILIFEELVDFYNIRMSTDETLEAITRQINLVHHLEEARHLVFGRQIVEYLFEKYSPSWSEKVRRNIQEYLAAYIVTTWKEYYNPDVYTDAGLPEPYDLVESSWNTESCRAHRKKVSAKIIEFLKERNMILEEPVL